MIASAVLDEERTGRLARALERWASRHRLGPATAQVAAGVQFVLDYVEHVPAYMREGLEAARLAGLEEEMSRVLEEAASYWATTEDIIPDRLGLLGILDDAYCSLTLIQAVSDGYERETARPLFSRNLRAANEAMRRFIGEPTASQLDMYVGSKLSADPMMQMVRALAAVAHESGPFTVGKEDRIWSGISTDEVVRARLAELGLA